MSSFITDDFCEEVVINDPKIIEQDCLPEGEDLICLYTIDLDVPWYKYYEFAPFDNAAQIDDKGYWYYNYENVEFDLEKTVKVGEDGIQQEIWVGRYDGGIYDDWISGKGLLEYIRDTSINGTAIAQVYPSVYLGDLIHFILDGGAGDDYVEGANNADILSGGSGNDKIWGLGGDDTIDGGDGHDHIYGGDGNDIIDGGDGGDTVYGGDGCDDITGGLGDDYLNGGEDADNISGGAGDDRLEGEEGDDWLDGGDGDDYIHGGSGDDSAAGGDGDDYIEMGSGDDLALGGAGDDYMEGNSGNDKLDGGDGDDQVFGGSGNDLVAGGAGDDLVKGGDGDDIVRGGTGEDEMWGGDGCDVFAFCEVSWECNDVIKDFSAGYDADQIDLTALDIDSVRVEETGYKTLVRLDLVMGNDVVQSILVDTQAGANLQSVFAKDTTYGSDKGSLVRLGEGMMVDTPSSSVLVAEADGMFIV